MKLDAESEGNMGTDLVVCLGAGPVAYLETDLIVELVNYFLADCEVGY